MNRDSKGRIKKGNIPWNKDTKGKQKAWNEGLLLSQKHRDNISKSKKGKPSWNKGLKGFGAGESNAFYGRTHSEESKKKSSLSHIGKKQSKEQVDNKTGLNSANWRGGKSFEPYSMEFNNKLKKDIRQRDNFKCQNCGRLQEENKIKLHIHHINYDKYNNWDDNLVSLCKSCHATTNHNRDFWQKHFEYLIWLKKRWT